MTVSRGVQGQDLHLKSEARICIYSDIKALRYLLGLINYHGKFQRSLASILGPLHEPLRKDVTQEWSETCHKAFDACKAQLISSKVLVHCDEAKPLLSWTVMHLVIQ